MSNLVIVESPAKAKTIQKYLGKDYDVVASMGHIRDLPKSRLGVSGGAVPRRLTFQISIASVPATIRASPEPDRRVSRS